MPTLSRSPAGGRARARPAYPGAGVALAPEELAELRRALRQDQRDLLEIKRELAWQRMIDDAIRVCRLLRKVEAQEAIKHWRDQPRVPAGNSDGGQWTNGSGGGGSALGAIAPAADAAAADLAATTRQTLQAIGQFAARARQGVSAAAAAVATPATAVAAGILMLSARPAGGATYEHTETLADGTIVTVTRHEDEVQSKVRGESPDGTITYATITVDDDGAPRVLDAAVQRPGRDPEPFDPATLTAASAAVINAATGGSGGRRGSGRRLPDTMGTPDGPEDFEPGGSPQPAREQTKPSNNYRETFFRAHPELRGRVNVHHSVEQQVLRKYPGRFTETELRSLGNLRGIPNNANSEVHLTRIRIMWNRFYKLNPNASRRQIIEHARNIDRELGRHFAPTVP